MQQLWKSSLLFLVACAVESTATMHTPCPTWFYRPQRGNDSVANGCECGTSLGGVVSCSNITGEVHVLDCFCMTSDGDHTNSTVVGRCIFNCVNSSAYNKDIIYHSVWPNTTELNQKSCGYLNRKGRFCGECRHNFFVPVYSYNFTCMQCSRNDWIKYLAVAFIPLTGFYFLVVLFSISATSPKLKGFCYCAQYIASAQNVRVILQSLHNTNYPFVLVSAKILSTMYGFWNLDFFRTLLPPFCLEISTLQSLSLDYIIAGYPLALIAVTYLLMFLYDRDNRAIVRLWTPFQRFLIQFKRQWDLKTSMIATFATFIFLSYGKLLSVSLDILVPTRAYNVTEKLVNVYLYYDSSIEYMGKEHLPFACLAIVILTLGTVIPVALQLLYPMLCFQRFLNHYNLNSENLRVCMECFQGYYRTRSDGGRDYRYLSGVFSIVRISLFFFYALSLSTIFYALSFLLFTLMGMVFLICQPYKEKFSIYNKVEGSFLLLLATWSGGIAFFDLATVKDHRFAIPALATTCVASLIPLVYISACTCSWLYHRRNVLRKLYKSKFPKSSSSTNSSEQDSLVNYG